MFKHFNVESQQESDRYRVAIFGSARPLPGSPVYQDTYELAYALAKEGIDLLTGGGPGLMEAASLGHKSGDPEGKVNSVGINIKLPFEQSVNQGVELANEHERFSTRLDEFMMLSNAVIVAPGGIGTALELFYTWQLIQVKHICRIPLILVGPQWKALIHWVIDTMLKDNYIHSEDLNSVICVENGAEALEAVLHAKKEHEALGADACVNWKLYGDKF